MIDAHFHLWRVGRNGFVWPGPDLAAIHRDFELSDFAALAGAHGVTGGVLVQSQPDEADTDFLLDLAEDAPLVLAVCGWTDLAAKDAPARVERLAARSKLRALRPMLQDIEDAGWILRAEVEPGVSAMIECGLAFDALVNPPRLPGLIAFKAAHENLRLILDHCGKPRIGGAGFAEWKAMIADLSAMPNVWCKLSGLVTEAPAGAPDAAFAPYVETVMERFGPHRIIWGSDWPVVTLARDYAGWLGLARSFCGADAAKAIFEDNARAAYGLPPGAEGTDEAS